MALVAPDAEAPAEPSEPVGLFVTGLVLLMFGLMMLMIGGIMSSICLLGACEGTGIGSIGGTMLLIAVLLLVPAVALLIPARRKRRAFNEARLAANRLRAQQVQAQGLTMDARRLGLQPEAHGPIASTCPDCGGPVRPGASECEFCGTLFQV